MYEISDDFRQELIQSHRICTLCQVFQPDGTFWKTLFPLAGQVNFSNDPVRRRATVRLSDPTGTLTPQDLDSVLTPYGTEFRLYRGIRLPGGVDYIDAAGFPAYTRNEFIPLGVFRVFTVNTFDSGDSFAIQLDGYDRAWEVGRRRFVTPYTIAAGTNFGTAISTMIDNRYDGLAYNFSPTTHTTPELKFDIGDDPWRRAQEMALAIGMEIFFDVEGICVMRPVPDPAVDPVVWAYAEGPAATIMYVDRALSSVDNFNHIVVTGADDTGDPVYGDFADEDPASPTYINGPYGDIPYFINSGYVTTNVQAQEMAEAEFLKHYGGVEQMQLSIVPNPAHDVGDVVSVTRTRSQLNYAYVVQSGAVNLEAVQPMPLTVRRRLIA